MENVTTLRALRQPSIRRALVRSLSFLLLIIVSAVSQTDKDRPQTVTLGGTETLALTSAINSDQEYSLLIHLPQGYATSTDRYPVIYVLDAQWDFPLVSAIYGQQYYDGFIPSAIIVGITWGGKDPKHDSLRARDLTPFHNSAIPQSGNAEKFLQAITTEIVPLIEARYRALSTGRSLIGSSFGGLFTLYAMFQKTPFFERFIMTSPAIGWDRGAIMDYENAFADEVRLLPARLFMAQGELEGGMEMYQQFVSTIASRDYTGLQMQTRVIEGAGHSGGKAEGFARGLQWIFALPRIPVDARILDRYEGEYELAPGTRVRVWRSENVLMAAFPGGAAVHLLAKNDAEFYVRGFYLHVRFETDEQGVVRGLVAEEYQRTSRAPKVR